MLSDGGPRDPSYQCIFRCVTTAEGAGERLRAQALPTTLKSRTTAKKPSLPQGGTDVPIITAFRLRDKQPSAAAPLRTWPFHLRRLLRLLRNHIRFSSHLLADVAISLLALQLQRRFDCNYGNVYTETCKNVTSHLSFTLTGRCATTASPLRGRHFYAIVAK